MREVFISETNEDLIDQMIIKIIKIELEGREWEK